MHYFYNQKSFGGQGNKDSRGIMCSSFSPDSVFRNFLTVLKEQLWCWDRSRDGFMFDRHLNPVLHIHFLKFGKLEINISDNFKGHFSEMLLYIELYINMNHILANMSFSDY